MILHGLYENGKIDIIEKDQLNKIEHNKQIEVEIIIDDHYLENHKNIAIKNARGALRKYSNPDIKALEESTWELAMKEKYGIS